jgi:hypothetical protein
VPVDSGEKFIVLCSQVKYIGYFDTEEEAARAYDKGILSLKGIGSHTNYPVSEYPEFQVCNAYYCLANDNAP